MSSVHTVCEKSYNTHAKQLNSHAYLSTVGSPGLLCFADSLCLYVRSSKNPFNLQTDRTVCSEWNSPTVRHDTGKRTEPSYGTARYDKANRTVLRYGTIQQNKQNCPTVDHDTTKQTELSYGMARYNKTNRTALR